MSVVASVLFMLVSVLGLGGTPVDHGYAPAPLVVSCASAPEAVIESGGSCGDPALLGTAEPVQLPAELASQVSDCEDTNVVFVDPATGVIYGDQDMNGRLDGDDCNWS
ncbi:hypothetical protein [Rhodococcus pyridinivorans]|uniref:hypothetical protein n=1 Tax=Rhodococcus pyridinivorans TaxID=103816 RepID=UPI00110F546F|nr:hypothetical protein [Rhodococcus pyridinivorans]